jgi:hypothetical protein
MPATAELSRPEHVLDHEFGARIGSQAGLQHAGFVGTDLPGIGLEFRTVRQHTREGGW